MNNNSQILIRILLLFSFAILLLFPPVGVVGLAFNEGSRRRNRIPRSALSPLGFPSPFNNHKCDAGYLKEALKNNECTVNKNYGFTCANPIKHLEITTKYREDLNKSQENHNTALLRVQDNIQKLARSLVWPTTKKAKEAVSRALGWIQTFKLTLA